MNKLLLSILAAISLSQASGIEKLGKYMCEEVNNEKSYYIIERNTNYVRDTKSGEVFNKTKDAFNNNGEPYEVFERGSMYLQNFTKVNDAYYVNWFDFNNNGTINFLKQLDCKPYN